MASDMPLFERLFTKEESLKKAREHLDFLRGELTGDPRTHTNTINEFVETRAITLEEIGTTAEELRSLYKAQARKQARKILDNMFSDLQNCHIWVRVLKGVLKDAGLTLEVVDSPREQL